MLSYRSFTLRSLALVVICFVLTLPVMAATPLVTLNMPANALVGEAFQFTAIFDNTGPGTGFGPFIDLVIPAGITFGNATIGADPVTTSTRIFPAGGCVAHPYGVDTFNVPLQVCGTPNDALVVLQLPFGSFTVNQPPAEITVTATMLDSNAHNVAQAIRSRGGFQYGNDELSNPCCDPTIVGPAGSSSPSYPATPITPIVARPEKVLVTNDREYATGNNFPYSYRINVDVANGQIINPLTIDDTLPPNLILAGAITTTPVCAVSTAGSPIAITINCGSVTGTAATNDVVITIPVSVPRDDSSGNPVIGALGTFVTVVNSATVNGTWVGPGTGASGAGFVMGGNNAPNIAARSFATQKGVQVNPDTGAPGPTPGDTLVYTIDFQVSDFFAFDTVSVDDVISDGQRWDTLAPQLTFTQHGTTVTVPMTAPNFSFTTNADGTQTAVFNVSGQLGGASLLGGCVPVGGTGGGGADCALFNGGATEGQITYRTLIQDSFAATFPSGDASLDQGDRLTNAARGQGNMLDVATLAPTGAVVADTATSETIVQRGTLQKTVYAVNGSTVIPVPLQLNIGDTITYRLVYNTPASDFENLVLSDFLPQPIFAASQMTAFSAVVSAVPPAAGTAHYGTTDTFHVLPAAPAPIMSVNAAENAVSFDYGTYDNTANTASVIDILFTVAVQNRPFAGNLTQTNVMRSSEGSTNNGTRNQSAIFSAQVLRPVLMMRKGVIGNSGAGTLNPPVAGPAPFTPPGTGGTRFGGTIGSDGLAIDDINSDLDQAAAGEIISFAIVVENIGNQGAFDIILRDILPAGFTIPAGGLNLRLTRGDGTVLDYRAVGSSVINVNPEALFGAGLEVVDPAGTPACQTFHPTDGSNILVLTYDLEVPPAFPGGLTLTNAGTMVNFAVAEAATNQVADLTAYAAWASVGVGMNAAPQYFRLSAATSGAVISDGAGGAAAAGRGAALRITDPLITKRGNPTLARPGESIEWWIDITNPDTLPIYNISLSDSLAPYMQLTEVVVTAGNYSVSGDTVTFTIGVLNPGESVRITIRTKVRGNPLPAPYSPVQQAACIPGGPTIIENQTCMDFDGGRMCTQATVYCMPDTLPSTGEVAWYWQWLHAGILLAFGAAGVALLRYVTRDIARLMELLPHRW